MAPTLAAPDWDAVRGQAGVNLPGAHPFHFLPGDVALGCGPERIGDADLRRVQRGGDHVERQVRRRQPEHHPRRHPSRQDPFLSLDYRYGVSIV